MTISAVLIRKSTSRTAAVENKTVVWVVIIPAGWFVVSNS